MSAIVVVDGHVGQDVRGVDPLDLVGGDEARLTNRGTIRSKIAFSFPLVRRRCLKLPRRKWSKGVSSRRSPRAYFASMS